MKTKLLFLFLGSFLVSNLTIAQNKNFRTSTLDEKSNYFEIVNKKNKELASLKGKTDRKSKKQIKQFERWKAFWKDRVLPNGSFVSATHTYNEWKKEQQRQNNLQLNSRTVSNVNWTSIGPSTLSTGLGRINTVAFNGTDTNTLYIASPGGGVWKTTDGGSTWVPKGDALGTMSVSDIVINPANTNILYLATGDWDGVTSRSIGVYKSTDGGDNWTITGLTFTLIENNLISKLLIDPNNVNTVFATTKNSIKRTTDGGTTWTDVFTENGALFNDIVYKEGSNTILYATSQTGKFYISTNNGTNWSVASTPATGGGRLDLALTAADVNLILTLDTNGVIRKSTDQGSTWTMVSSVPIYESQGGYNQTLAISPINKNLILVGGVTGQRSTDGGSNWVVYLDHEWTTGDPFTPAHVDHHDIKFVPGTNIAFDVNDGGIIKGDASLDTQWTDLTAGLAITQYYSIDGTPQNIGRFFGGAQDNDATHFDGATIGIIGTGDGVNGLIDYSNQDIAWVGGNNGLLLRSLNNFTSESVVNTPGGPFLWELEIHPTVPTTIFGGFDDIYKSTNRGDSWTNLSSGVGDIEFISIAPSNADVIYVSGNNGVAKTTNGGTSWQDINLPQNGTVKSIEVHATNTSEIYIAYSGYLAGKVYKSTDGGVNWTNITGSLPNVPTHKIIYRTGTTDGELFLATDLGVYYRTNTAGDWVRFGTGLPNVAVNDLEIHYGTEKLRVATYGRGMWEVPIDANSLSVADNQLPGNSVSLYPNPTVNKNFNIQLNNLEGESGILIYNIIGSVVKDFTSSDSLIPVDLNDFSGGTYIVKITNNNKSITKLLLVK